MVLKTVKRYWFLAKTAVFIAYAAIRTVWEFRGEIDYEMAERDREELEKLRDELNDDSA